MGVSINPTEFQTVDGFYEPEGAGLFLALSPVLIAGVVLLLALAVVVGWSMGARRRPSDDPTGRIYDSIRKAVAVAVGAPRDDVVSSARRLQAAIDDNLGAVLRVSSGLNGACDALERALEGLDDRHPGRPPADRDARSGIEKLVINARRVVVNTLRPTAGDATGPDGDDAHDEGGHRHRGGDDGRAPGAHEPGPVDAKTQVARVRAAVHAVADHWSDRPARLEELRAARRQLTGGTTSSAAGRFPSRSAKSKP